MAGDDAVARDDLVVHPEIAAAVGDELVDLFEGAGIEQQLDPLAGGQLAGGVLPLEALGAAAQLGAAFEVVERVFWMSLRFYGLRFLPVLQELLEPDVGQRMVEQLIDHRGGQVQMSAPIRAASTMWIGWRQLATSTSVVNS